MEHAVAYAASTWLHELHRRIGGTQLMKFHLYRYRYFVDTSPRRQYCRYAAACIKLHKMDNEKEALLEYLESLEPRPPRLDALRDLLDENQNHK